MTAFNQEGQVNRLAGPGSLSVPIWVSLESLARRLCEEQHPVGSLPQWRGDSIYLVSVASSGKMITSIISASTEEKATTVALKTAEGHGWKVVGCQKASFDDGSGSHASVTIESPGLNPG
jgi:hypothetical protein